MRELAHENRVEMLQTHDLVDHLARFQDVAIEREMMGSKGLSPFINAVPKIFPDDLFYKVVEVLGVPGMDSQSQFALS